MVLICLSFLLIWSVTFKANSIHRLTSLHEPPPSNATWPGCRAWHKPGPSVPGTGSSGEPNPGLQKLMETQGFTNIYYELWDYLFWIVVKSEPNLDKLMNIRRIDFNHHSVGDSTTPTATNRRMYHRYWLVYISPHQQSAVKGMADDGDASTTLGSWLIVTTVSTYVNIHNHNIVMQIWPWNTMEWPMVMMISR